METCMNYCNEEVAFISSDERRWINRVRKLKNDYPEFVEVIKEPEENDGCIYAKIPVRWIWVRPPKKMNFTAEQKQEMAKRLAYAREQQQYSGK